MAGAKSFRELKVYVAARDGGMLSRMIDRADDFCKHAPATDYRSIGRLEEESPFTDH